MVIHRFKNNVMSIKHEIYDSIPDTLGELNTLLLYNYRDAVNSEVFETYNLDSSTIAYDFQTTHGSYMITNNDLEKFRLGKVVKLYPNRPNAIRKLW